MHSASTRERSVNRVQRAHGDWTPMFFCPFLKSKAHCMDWTEFAGRRDNKMSHLHVITSSFPIKNKHNYVCNDYLFCETKFYMRAIKYVETQRSY